jgi:PAS domain S-box-containing protein
MSERMPFTILVVEDHEDNRKSLAFLLAQEGYNVLEAPTGSQGVQLARAADLVVLDVRLPDMNGLEVCRRIKADPATALVPVILMSGHYTGSENKAEGLEGGADAYFTKPADPPVLLGQIKALQRIRQTELALLASEERYRRIVETAAEGVWMLDAIGRTTFANARLARMLGCSVAEIMERSLDEFTDERGCAEAAGLLRGGERGEAQREIRFRRADGSDFWALVSASLLRHQNACSTFSSGSTSAESNGSNEDQPGGVLLMVSDITERKRLEEHMLQAQKLEAVATLGGGVAHDFNNLLAIINGYSEILLAQVSTTDPLREMIEPIRTAAERAARLTRQLLDFSRRTILAPQATDLNRLLRDLTGLMRPVLGERIELLLALDPDLGRVRVDPSRLEQAILNLTVNARDAMPQGGTLTVRTRNMDRPSPLPPDLPAGPYIALEVRDTGAGMTEAVKARIFEPFFTTREVGKGTGLGLATVYGFLRQSDGHIRVDSAPGQGATFTIYLPQVEAGSDQ